MTVTAQQRALRFYAFLWYIAAPVIRILLYVRCMRGKEELSRLSERTGQGWQNQRPDGPLIWLHAVSVGESIAARTLADALLQRSQDCTILITTNTVTAAAEIAKAAQKWQGRCAHSYQPLDHKKWVDRFLTYWRPDCAVFLESDFWPMLITQAHAHSIPVIFASAQLSPHSLAKWQQRPALAAAVFGSADRIYSVDDEQTAAFTALRGGTPSPSITTHGSLKVSVSALAADAHYTAMLSKAAAGRPILVCASTHDGEEQMLLQAAAHCADAGYPVFTIIAPRHPIRAAAVSALMPTAGRRSQQQPATPADDSYLNDTLGEMGSLFSVADIVFLGGSLVPLGGHNPLEPALFGAALLTGPFIEKNKHEFEALHTRGAVTILSNTPEKSAMVALLADKILHLVTSRPISQAQKQKSQKYAQDACSRAEPIADYICSQIRQGNNQ
ncbi:MAG: 3-deoxy-D-manno-octulosonic acid transferase [Alphaproteobacteria bacterium]|nr:3-deoxy-D-manno-octulosonic acid transferase [Alphaproteobacteria bacterium]